MRTSVHFEFQGNDFWDIVNKWQNSIGWAVIERNDSSILCQKQSLIFGPLMKIYVEKNGVTVNIQAWLELSNLNRVLALGTQSNEVSIDTASKSIPDIVIGVIPQAECRNTFNELLSLLKQQAVK